MQHMNATQQSNNFQLKTEVVDLLPTGRIAHEVSMSLRDLEAIRVSSSMVPASKHGLETITGASCETGAQ